MKEINQSFFWQKALISIEKNREKNLEDLVLKNEDLIKARRISKFLFIEHETFLIKNSNESYLINPHILRFVKIEPGAIKKGNDVAKKYLIDSLKNSELNPYPPTIEIGTSTNCTRKCKSCVQYYENIPINVMKKDTWSNILEQLRGAYNLIDNSSKPTIHLHWYNEPLLDLYLEQRLDELKLNNVDNVVLITNGDLLDNEKAINLSRKMEFLIISSKSKSIYSKFEHFNKSYQNITCIDHSIYNKGIEGFNRCGSVYEFVSDKPKKCDKGFNIQIDFDGEIYLCCNDMRKTKSVGNVNSENMFDIWFSEKIRPMKEALAQGNFIGAPCKYCTFDFK